MSVRWTKIPPDIGCALWNTLRVRLGKDVSVYETCTDPDGEYGSPYILTVVGTSNGTTPLLRCESRRGSAQNTEEANPWVHDFSVPNGN